MNARTLNPACLRLPGLSGAVLLVLVLVLAGGCVSTGARQDAPPPVWRLAPQSLGRSLSLQQQLTVTVAGRRQPPIDALVEADASHVAIALLGAGQVLARIDWDGQTLQADASARLPDLVSGERLLSDVQLAFWPLPALQPALPAGWTLTDAKGWRTLRHEGTAVARVSGAEGTHVVIENLRYHYQIVIDSVTAGGQ